MAIWEEANEDHSGCGHDPCDLCSTRAERDAALARAEKAEQALAAAEAGRREAEASVAVLVDEFGQTCCAQRCVSDHHNTYCPWASLPASAKAHAERVEKGGGRKPLYESPTLGRGKFVRDGVPEEIYRRGGNEPIDTLPEDEMHAALVAKLQEEAWEVAHANGVGLIEEMGDLLEVMEEIANRSGFDMNFVRDSRALKATMRGQFHRGYFLREQFIPKEPRR